ncbi:isopentenyl-diphosphate Delta-isomerase [Corynebacterium appendicis]|uniref:isopentenyl-diphosphate Delta-isomerase n=1 Tax=Corynebacterium appendicis TaxID=163202 RepID=UPI0021AFD563|nr:isopentenyl-diphosphate Delta-isomerase [Corynebacterium appendicis]MCT1683357.1 isopentenyl-diphosphate Delta-isomerase [Corynebacterium appendicis]
MDELVVLCTEDGHKAGTALKAEVHTATTPLHFAFSAWLFDDCGNVLLTRRALNKLTWPGVWTNSFCGHPGPDETFEEALVRRASEELGTTVKKIESVLPSFRYRAVDASGIVENEICPVFFAEVDGELNPNPDEVCEFEWVSMENLKEAVERVPFIFSPWLVEELEQFPE